MTNASTEEMTASKSGLDSAGRSTRRAHLLRAGTIGLAAGLVAVAFRHALHWVEHERGQLLAGLEEHAAWGWAVLPAIGLVVGCGVGWVTQRMAPEAAGSGVPHLKGALLHLRSFDNVLLIPVKFAAGVVGIGAGLSLGREGPTVQMGAATARLLMGPLRATRADMPQLLSAGAGAGLAAAFNAPLAGLIFVIEELHRELSSRTAAGALVAAVCATVVGQTLAGDTPSFEVTGLSAMSPSSLPLAVVTGFVAGLGGAMFNRTLMWSHASALRLRRVPRWAHPGVAGMGVGLLAWWMPSAVGGGHGVAQTILSGTAQWTLAGVVLLLIGKLLATAASYASGAPGGIFAPMLLMGALVGTAVSMAIGALGLPIEADPKTLAVLGMAGFFVGSVRASLTGIVLISEMTGGYQLLFAICIASLAAYIAAEMMKDRPIYEALLEADLRRSGPRRTGNEPHLVYLGIQSRAPVAGRTIKSAGLPAGCLVVAIDRAGVPVLPTAGTTLLPGDHVSILFPGDAPERAMEIATLCTGI
jgi:CIC family chloride channel protein